ncbi:MAG TPA: nuclear transport factor 2 family protein [Ferruginibacter sp.]|nr:nuclear transport factor 2 family protein [Ferruginibacter sp.]
MKRIIVLSILLLRYFCSHAQDDKLKAEINSIEEKSRLAILQKDSVSLRRLWSPAFMVNTPTNNVIIGNQVDMVIRGQISYTSYKGVMEEMLVSGDIVITMGHETVVAVMGNRNGGQPIERRYTNIWKRQKEGWMLIARHGSELCAK